MPDDKLKAMDSAVLDVRDFLQEAASWFKEFSGAGIADDAWLKTRAHQMLKAASDLRTNWQTIKTNITPEH